MAEELSTEFDEPVVEVVEVAVPNPPAPPGPAPFLSRHRHCRRCRWCSPLRCQTALVADAVAVPARADCRGAGAGTSTPLPPVAVELSVSDVLLTAVTVSVLAAVGTAPEFALAELPPLPSRWHSG